MRDAQLRLHKLQQLAPAEEAANIPPTPYSSQAAYQAAEQRLFLAVDEMRALNRRLDDLHRGNPNPWPMPPPTPPFPLKGLTTPAAAAGDLAGPSTPAGVARSSAAGGQSGMDSHGSRVELGASAASEGAAAGEAVPLLASGDESASRGLRRRQRQEGVR
ncbi:hypothetical protein ABPG77_010173 [Micractinium sp. CCAP 211/92]